MNKKTIRDIDLKGRKVVMRVDFNVPIKEGVISDDTRIQAALPSIKYILEQGASLVLMSHLGRPKGKGYEADFSLRPVAERLSACLAQQVKFAEDCQEATAQAEALQPGEVLMLENTRFYKAEQGKVKKTDDMTDEELAAKKAELKAAKQAMAEKLASYGEIYVNDAFGTAHRDHASTASICKYIKAKGGQCVAGFLMEKELEYLGSAVENPVRPFAAILGGAKVSDKLAVVRNLLQKVDTLIIGGGMAYTFLAAKGYSVGTSLLDETKIDYCKDMLKKADEKGVKILLPVDVTITKSFPDPIDAEIEVQIADADKIISMTTRIAAPLRFKLCSF